MRPFNNRSKEKVSQQHNGKREQKSRANNFYDYCFLTKRTVYKSESVDRLPSVRFECSDRL